MRNNPAGFAQKVLAVTEILKILSGWEGWFTPAFFPQAIWPFKDAGASHPSQPER
jgi:hypothetical protein